MKILKTPITNPYLNRKFTCSTCGTEIALEDEDLKSVASLDKGCLTTTEEYLYLQVHHAFNIKGIKCPYCNNYILLSWQEQPRTVSSSRIQVDGKVNILGESLIW